MATLSAPTLESLLANVRLLLRQSDADNSSWTDAELTGYINEGIRRYFSEVVNTGEGQFAARTTLNTTSGQETVSLPSDCFSVRALYRTVSGGYEALPYRNNLNEGYSTTGEAGGDSYLPYYYLRANNLVLRPVPNFTQSDAFVLEYIAFPETLVSTSDTMTTGVSPVFKDLIEAYAAYKAKLSESAVSGGTTYAPFKANVDDLYSAFKESITQRSFYPTAVKPFNPEEN
jgi:hypothetical protein